MTPERWKQVNRLFQSALDVDPSNRDDFLDNACANDESLRNQVETLLAADGHAEAFLDGNAFADADSLFDSQKPPLASGHSLGHYEIISVLGSGGMGKVYLAKDSKLNRSVAVKTLPARLSGGSDHIKRFRTEAKAAANLNHPNVATVFSVEETEDKQVFITMEYVEGKPLSSVVSANGLDLRTFLDWFISITDALFHAHEKGIIHRDIKPGNIMITPAGDPKILDFGLARIDRSVLAGDDSSLGLTKTGQILGTPAYMSPEQAEGKLTDHRSDIFSIGVVMYEAITGERPFKGDSYASVISKLMTEQPRDVAEFRPEIPFLLSRLIMKCLNKEPRYRYQSMAEVCVILREISSAIESGASFSRPGKAFGVSKTWSASSVLSVIVISALVLFSAFAGYKWFTGQASIAPVVTRFSVDPPIDQEQSLFETRISPDGERLVFASRQRDTKTLFLRSLDSFQMAAIPGTENARRPFFSPDSKWVGFFLDSGALKKVDLSGGTPLTICGKCKPPFEALWTHNDSIIVADAEGLYSISAEGGAIERLTRVDAAKGEKAHRSPQRLPDPNKILFSIVASDKVRFAVLFLDTKQVRIIEGVEGSSSTHGGTSFVQFVNTGHIVFSKTGQLLGVRFSPDDLTISGKPVPLFEGTFAIPNFQIANNGTLIYLPQTTNDENLLVWVSRSGASTPVLDKRANYRSPRISPAGGEIAIQIGGDIWKYDLESQRGTRLTFEGGNQSPLWTPDGRDIVYASKTGKNWKIIKKSSDGSGDAEVLFTSQNRHLPYSWHPSGRLLAMASVPAVNNSDLVTLSLDSGKAEPFADTDFKEDTPRFSPDGSRVAYFSMETGRVEVYVRRWGPEGGKETISNGGGMYPVWSRDGNELFYRRGQKLIAAKLALGGLSAIGKPNVLFEGKYLIAFDVDQSGDRFLMVRNEQGTMPKHLNVVLNWTGELARTIGPAN